MFPVVLALLAVMFPKQVIRIITAVAISLFSIIAGFSIGLFYVPSALAMLLAVGVPDTAKFRVG